MCQLLNDEMSVLHLKLCFELYWRIMYKNGKKTDLYIQLYIKNYLFHNIFTYLSNPLKGTNKHLKIISKIMKKEAI